MQQDTTSCALVAASDFNSGHFSNLWRIGAFDTVVAVDAGLAHLRSVGCEPDVIVGDFDSLGHVPNGDRVLRYPTHKDKSDLELALDSAVRDGVRDVTVYGALGRRLDHTVANLHLCARIAEQGISMQIVGIDSVVRILVGPGECALPALSSGTVSVFSAVNESRGVTETGMEYPLENAVLSNRTTLGLSNELIGKPATVSVECGTLYIFHPCR